ncbi:MAG: hypothetical protein FWG67_00145 [Defluviitaleaceae bacterium]|nr:hypothetical protein [Defluviitaleaceae bacterium]
MQISFYAKKRNNHLFPLSEGEKIHIGSEDGRRDFTHLNYSELLKGNYIPNTLWIWLERSDAVNIGDLMNKFPTIESLYLFRDLIPFEKTDLENLKTFTLGRFTSKESSDNLENFRWNPEQILPNARAFFNFDKLHFDLGGFQPENLPSLEWLECHNLDEEGILLDKISRFKTVTDLTLERVGNQNIFEAFNNRLKVLKLAGFTKGFSFDKISDQTNLEILYINGYSQELDLEWLHTLKLKELHLLNCTKIINTEFLLEMENLESVIITNCKKALSRDLKLKLQAKGYSFLKI